MPATGAPANDDYRNRRLLPDAYGTLPTTEGEPYPSNVHATIEAGEPLPPLNLETGRRTVWYVRGVAGMPCITRTQLGSETLIKCPRSHTPSLPPIATGAAVCVTYDPPPPLCVASHGPLPVARFKWQLPAGYPVGVCMIRVIRQYQEGGYGSYVRVYRDTKGTFAGLSLVAESWATNAER